MNPAGGRRLMKSWRRETGYFRGIKRENANDLELQSFTFIPGSISTYTFGKTYKP